MAENYFIDNKGRVRFVLPIKDVAYALRTSVDTVVSLINLGMIGSLDLNSKVVPMSELNRFANEHLGENLKKLIDDEKAKRHVVRQLRSV